MANLLDRSSLVLTPTSYNNGEALCIKPDDASGDFDFSRNSAATRVNAQGLVENVQILSSNLVQNPSFSEEGVQEVSNGSFSQEGSEIITNGDFSNGSTGWNLGGTAEVLNGVGNFFSDGDYFRQLGILSANVNYKITFDINVISGTIYAAYDGTTAPTIISEVGSTTQKVYYNTSSGGDLWFYGINFRGSIDNVSVREVAQNWTLNTGWSIGENKAICNGTTANLIQSNVGTANKNFKLVFTISDYISGVVRPAFVGLNAESPDFSGNGTYTTYISSLTDLRFVFYSTSFNGSITNISVKEVLQDWTAISSSALSIDNGALKISNVTQGYGKAGQSFSTISGKTYKIKFNGFVGTAAQFQYRLGTTEAGTNIIIQAYSTNQTVEAQFTAISSLTYLTFVTQSAATGVYTNIDDVSIIEITDDTSLPRINYENFSYQDVLGSEEIVNGDFSNGSANWIKQSSWTISNGTANYDGISSGNYLRQSWSPLTIGKTYRMTFDISDGSAYLQIRSGTSLLFEGLNIVLYGTGSHVIEAKAISNLDNLRIYAYTSGGGTSFSIDNVSVKEITGQ